MLLIGKGAAGASALSWQLLIPILNTLIRPLPITQVAWASARPDVRTWEQQRVQSVWEREREYLTGPWGLVGKSQPDTGETQSSL